MAVVEAAVEGGGYDDYMRICGTEEPFGWRVSLRLAHHETQKARKGKNYFHVNSTEGWDHQTPKETRTN